MKIAYIYDVIYPYVKGGAEKRFWELAIRLSAKGHEVHIFGMKSWEGEAHFIKEGVHIHGISKHRQLYKRSGRRRARQVISFSLKVLTALWKEKFDIIDCNEFPYLPFFPVKIYCSLKKAPLVITWQEVWDKYWYKYLGFIKGSMARFIEKMVIRLTGNIIAHSEPIKKELIRCGADKDNIIIIPDGTDVKLIESILPNIEHSDLIFAGRLIKDKNVDMLIKSVAVLKKELNNIKCLIIGEGPEKERLMELADRLDLGDNIVFKDFLQYQELISLVKASKVFVFPSTREGFGIVVIEAMACGLPVVTVSDPMNAASALIRNGENGLLCSLDEKDIAQKALLLLKDETLRLKIAQFIPNFVNSYTWDGIADKNEEFYQYLVNKN